jgi:methyl-accepting chemotaxis protein
MEKINKWFKNLKLSTKMMVFILAISLIIISITLGYILVTSKKLANKNVYNYIDSYTREYANQTRAEINVDIDVARTLAHAFQDYKKFPEYARIEIIKGITKQVIEQNPNFLSVYSHWEIGVLDSSWTKSYGRIYYNYYQANNKILYIQDSMNVNGDIPGSPYYMMKTNPKETVEDPYYCTYTGNKADEILETSVCAPMIDNGKFLGKVGIDLEIDRFKKIIDKIRPFENSYSFLLSNSGKYITAPGIGQNLTGKSIEKEKPELSKQHNILAKIKGGESFSFIVNENGKDYYYSFAPVQIGKTGTPWSLAIVVPINVVMQEANSTFLRSIIIGILGLVILGFSVFFLTKKVILPLTLTTKTLSEMATSGIIDDSRKVFIKSKDEIGKMARALNKLMDELLKTANFAKEIGAGNLKASYEPLSKDDILGNSLLEMQASLQKAAEEEEKRKIEDEKRNWATEGIAKFSDILRKNNNDIDALSFNIIKNLVEYTSANQGGFFVVNDSEAEHYLEMSACYAYDRQKFFQKKVYAGEGMIGACYKEKESIYITNIPEDYINISSGLGEANPSSLLIIPLKLNEEVFGLIEIASFNLFEKHEIEFIEKVGESIASTISNVKINSKTALLLEQSQQQAELMKTQEEEMRQNMEELTVTQEESARKAARMEQMVNDMQIQTEMMKLQEEEMKKQALETEGVMSALNRASMTIEYDISGKIIDINDNFLEFVHKTREQVIGTHHLHNIDFETDQDLKYDDFWDDLISGKSHKLKSKVDISGKTFWLMETYSPIIDNNGKTIKILKIAIDVTDNEMKENIIKQQLSELKSHEEELKQNIEELQTVQEQMKTKEYLIKLLSETLNVDEAKITDMISKIK